MKVDPCDSSYMPSLVVVSGGNSFTALTELATVHVRNTNTIVTLITNVKKVSVLLRKVISISIQLVVVRYIVIDKSMG